MKTKTTAVRRGLSLFVVLTMCLSLLQLPAFAAEENAQGHQHSFACYEGYTLLCQADEDHVHTSACFNVPEGAALICGLEEGAEHTHGDACTSLGHLLICDQAEHTHGDGCYAAMPIDQLEPLPQPEPLPALIEVNDGSSTEVDDLGNAYETPDYVVWEDPSENGESDITDEDFSEAPDIGIDNQLPGSDEGTLPPAEEDVTQPEPSEEPEKEENQDTSSEEPKDEGDQDASSEEPKDEGNQDTSSEESKDEGNQDASSEESKDEGNQDASSEESAENTPSAPESAGEPAEAGETESGSDTSIPDQDPPLADEPQLNCDLAEHVHSEACYVEIYECRAEAEAEASACTCEYMCTWFWGKYVKVNQDCPVCSHATEEELDPYTYDPAHPENFVCQGKQVVIPGSKADCTHNAVISGGSMWESWFPGGGSEDLIPATCHSPATDQEPISCMNCDAMWLWSFDPNSSIDPNAHYYGKNEPVIVKEATCTEDGLQKQTCLFCGDIESVLKGGHTMPEDESAIEHKEPTCSEPGYDKYTCTICGEEDVKVLTVPHTWPKGKVPIEQQGICTVCNATAYQVYTYEDGATPSGSGYEIQLCARVIREADGTVYGVDKDGNRLEGDKFTVLINESLMGKVKSGTDSEGNAIMTYVAGYRNMDMRADETATLYQPGDEIAYADVPGMFVGDNGSWGNYYSGNSYKAVYLADVRLPVLEDAGGFAIGMVPYRFAPSGYSRAGISATSQGVTVTSDYNEKNNTVTLTYTIPAGYSADTVSIDASADVWKAFAQIQDTRWGHNGTQPGDSLGPVFIKLVNKSDKVFTYSADSFVLQSPSWTGESAYLPEINTFDGVNPPESAIPSRVSNGALKYLYSSDKDLVYDQLSDEVLSEKLIEKGYENGVEDLHQFYLDYYNNFYSESKDGPWSSLSEIPYDLLVQRDEGIFGGQSSAAASPKPKETNPEVAGVGYSYPYTRLLSVVPGNETGAKDLEGAYAIGNYMTSGSQALDGYDSSANSVWNQLGKDGSGTLTGMSFYFDSEMNDFYQNTEYGIEVGFSLKEVPPEPQPETTELTVIKKWADSNGNAIAAPSTSIVVELRDGSTIKEYATLNAANSWTHTWKDLAADGNWSVRETSVPSGYTSTQTQDGTVVTITNTLIPTTPETPPTTPENPPVTPPPGGNTPRDPNPNPPPVLTELPDPNVPGAPEEVVIVEEEVPLTYVKTWDPEEEEYTYIPEEEVPLADMVPQTGDSTVTALWAGLSLASLSGMGTLLLTRSRKKEEET